METLKQFPNAKIVGEVWSSHDSRGTSGGDVTLPSLPQVDAVLTQGGGDDHGIVQAFEQAGRKTPIIEGGGSSNFLKWWSEQFKKNGYKTIRTTRRPVSAGRRSGLHLPFSTARILLSRCSCPTDNHRR